MKFKNFLDWLNWHTFKFGWKLNERQIFIDGKELKYYRFWEHKNYKIMRYVCVIYGEEGPGGRK